MTTPSECERNPVTVHQIGLDQQEVVLLNTLCNGKPAMLDEFTFYADHVPDTSVDVLLVDCDEPEALEQLHTLPQPQHRHLVLVTARQRNNCRYPTLQRPLSLAGVRDTLSALTGLA